MSLAPRPLPRRYQLPLACITFATSHSAMTKRTQQAMQAFAQSNAPAPRPPAGYASYPPGYPPGYPPMNMPPGYPPAGMPPPGFPFPPGMAGMPPPVSGAPAAAAAPPADPASAAAPPAAEAEPAGDEDEQPAKRARLGEAGQPGE